MKCPKLDLRNCPRHRLSQLKRLQNQDLKPGSYWTGCHKLDRAPGSPRIGEVWGEGSFLEEGIREEESHPEEEIQEEESHPEVVIQEEGSHPEVEIQEEERHPEVEIQEEENLLEVEIQEG